MKKSTLLIIILFIIGLSSEAIAGWVIRVRYSSFEGDVSHETMMIQNNILRSTGIDGTFIFDLGNDLLTVINDESKTFWQVKISEMRATYNQTTRKFIGEMLLSFPDNERELYRDLFLEMENMYIEVDPEKLETVNIRIEKTDEIETIAGFVATKYLVLVDDVEVEEKWLTKDLDLSKDINLKNMAESLIAISPLLGEEMLYEYTETYLTLFEKGFEVRSVSSTGELTEVVSAENQNIEAGLFVVPDNYRKITIEDMMMMEFGKAGDNEENDQ